MSTDDNEDYEVGYGKPPKKGQFKKGQSGNPKGRPKKTDKEKPSPSQELAEFLAEEVTVSINGRNQKVTRLKAFLWRNYTGAMQGDGPSSRLLMAMIRDLKLFDPATLVGPSAFLVLPPPRPNEEKLRWMEEQQRPFREGTWRPPIDDNVVDFDERKKKTG